MKEIQKPLPGSKEAIEAGCICPVSDNAHGAGAYDVGDHPCYWVNGDCPIHGTGAGDDLHTV